MSDALRLEHLDIDFSGDDGPLRAVHDLSLAVPRGGIVCLVGESGCGKSLTARAVMGLLPERARASGRILLETSRGVVDIPRLSERELRRLRGPGMAMIFQEPMTALNPVLRVGRQVDEVLRLHLGMSRREARAETIRLFAEVGIPAPESRYDDYPHRLSGGMRQRVMIAAALACSPSLLLADEPTTALDATIQGQILRLIHEQSRKNGMAVLLITHDLSVVGQMADSVGVMYAGRLVEWGDADAVLAAPAHPYTRGLLRCAPDRAQIGARRLPAIPGTVPPLTRMPAGCPFAPRCSQAGDDCRRNPPPLQPIGDGHAAACFRA
ncbi:MAG: ABC transporter ATP-binding protein [Desulfovibrio sp.]|uniref:ABC transporter ATP-binding protein n=1 Tax=Desulfovibrio sp. TaxID=885 RepID=UPI0025B8B4F2|nr:ABC transporter ATP-binding protein [Desulfovibrio sp.]MCI7568565.1 ABC transporter ATP-binding protein [Desulfovibrio sp.]